MKSIIAQYRQQIREATTRDEVNDTQTSIHLDYENGYIDDEDMECLLERAVDAYDEIFSIVIHSTNKPMPLNYKYQGPMPYQSYKNPQDTQFTINLDHLSSKTDAITNLTNAEIREIFLNEAEAKHAEQARVAEEARYSTAKLIVKIFLGYVILTGVFLIIALTR